MKIKKMSFLAALVAAGGISAADIDLPKPETTGGMPLQEALANRRTDRKFSSKPLSRELLSNLLWSAIGVNRADGKRTAPTALNRQELTLYVCIPEGTFRYDATANKLVQTSEKRAGDAPLMLFYKGNADLNRTRVLSIVGTRHCTAYGQDLIRRFCDDLRQICPDVLIISGLAYGVDICAHRNALRTGFDTAAVLAHGLDTVYPSSHRETACEMTSHGGLITEFLTQTNADKVNFVRRNRIVAGMADATLLVESAERGGGLITTSIAQSYGREVFAFPGAVGMAYSEGCNRLIRDNGAALITCAADLAASMAWDSDQALLHARQQGIERQLFPELTGDERLIVATLAKTNDMQTNMLAARSGIPVQRMSALLFSLEMKGVVKMYAGGIYHLLQ